MNKEGLKTIVDTLKGDLNALEMRLSQLVDDDEVSYDDIREVCSDIPGMYDRSPNFTARDCVRRENANAERYGFPKKAFAL